jgi:hypothetical protein
MVVALLYVAVFAGGLLTIFNPCLSGGRRRRGRTSRSRGVALCDVRLRAVDRGSVGNTVAADRV